MKNTKRAAASSSTTEEEGEKKLTPKQAAFVLLYPVLRNASQAARKAGYKHKAAGWELLNLPAYANVQAAVKTEIGDVVANLRGQREPILTRLFQMAFFDPARLYHKNPQTKELEFDLAKSDPEDRMCISTINEKVHAGGVTRSFKKDNSVLALRLLAQAAGLLGEPTPDLGKTDAETALELENFLDSLNPPEESSGADP